ncbi:MAG TPA: tetratricopeptide repeat protein [Tepidisphaeraceae bacterium]|jgi:tetratricopeptide (TPR) repeat protein
MNRAIKFVCLSFFLCACSSHNAAPQAETPKLNSDEASLPVAKDPPLTANTRYAAGQLAESQGNVDAAIHQYNKALDIDSKHLPSLYRLGVIAAEQKKYDQSIAIWKQYITLSKDAPEGYGNLGYCYELATKPNLAEETYKKGIELDPKNGPCRTNYGLMLARRGKIQEAVRMWNPVLNNAEIHYDLAGIYAQDGRKQEAKAEYQKALACDPTLIDARARLSEIDSNN